jgi:predicted DNA repair protein MutK
MPAGSLLTLLDDVASVLDDVAVMTKVAAKKTTGILGDDLALNAQQVTGVSADRELPVVWAVAKGSLVNKAILVPAALTLSVVAPWSVTPLLMVGGAYLCFEGCEKLAHKFLHHAGEDAAGHAELVQAVADPATDLVAREKEKIKGAIRTDFVLSAEIIAISLASVAESAFTVKVVVMIAIALIMTIGVYGFVAGIVKLDDLGLHLTRAAGDGRGARARRATGRTILRGAPWIMRALTVVGTAAMFLVGGGILVHGIPPLHHAIEDLGKGAGSALGAVLPTVLDGVLGVVAGALLLVVVGAVKRVVGRFRRPKAPAPAAAAPASDD